MSNKRHHHLERTKEFLPERIVIFFRDVCGNRYATKAEICKTVACSPKSVSPALSKLRRSGFRILMQWSWKRQCWTYNIAKIK